MAGPIRVNSCSFVVKRALSLRFLRYLLFSFSVFQFLSSTAFSQTAVTNWQTALNVFKKSAAFIAKDRFPEATAALRAASTNLPPPYASIAAQFLDQLNSTLQTSTNHDDPERFRALSELCVELHDYEAALQLMRRAGTNALSDNRLFAWCLFESGDLKAAAAEYQRRLSAEPVEFWQEYYREQLRLIEQRPLKPTNAQFATEAAKERYLKGLEMHGDLLGVLVELARVPSDLQSSETIQVYQLVRQCLGGLADEKGLEAWEDKLLAQYKSDAELSAIIMVARGQRAYRLKDMKLSEALFRKVAADAPNSSAYPDALYGLGQTLQEEQRYDLAIAEYSKIFSTKINEGIRDPENPEDYPNYRFKSALHISECYEAVNDINKALDYAKMARDRYKFISYCHTCLQETRQKITDRVARLEKSLKKSD